MLFATLETSVRNIDRQITNHFINGYSWICKQTTTSPCESVPFNVRRSSGSRPTYSRCRLRESKL